MLSVILGIIGIFVPLLPTTPFLLLAAACFFRSSDFLYNKLITNRFLGFYIQNYRENKAIPIKLKLFSISFLWITILYSICFVINNIFVRFILAIIAILVSWHILSLRTIKRKKINNGTRNLD